MNTYRIFWSPEGRCIATIKARTPRAAIQIIRDMGFKVEFAS
jgi:hypothetical protein